MTSTVRIYTARWVLPIVTPPLKGGAVAVENGVVRDVGPLHDVRIRSPGAAEIELGRAILLPGLTNAHTHLSLTHLGGRFPPGTPYLEWLAEITRSAVAMEETEVRASVRTGLDESWRLGTAVLGEISTRPEGAGEIRSDGRFLARVFFEFLGVTQERGERRFAAARDRALELFREGGGPVFPGLSPHAPYSVWPPLWETAARFSMEHRLPWSTHLGESPYEEEFLLKGTGPLRQHLISLGVWDGSFPVPGVTGAELLEKHGCLSELSLIVHGVHLSRGDIRLLARRGASVCLCPRSNAYFSLPRPPVRALHESGVNLCLGTDSKASNTDLSLWAEMRALQELAPRIPARTLLEMATVNGARALGLAPRAGSIQPGAAALLVAVEAETLGDDDPFEFLVREPVEGGIRPLAHDSLGPGERPNT